MICDTERRSYEEKEGEKAEEGATENRSIGKWRTINCRKKERQVLQMKTEKQREKSNQTKIFKLLIINP